MEVKMLLCYLTMILENDQNNILEAKIMMFVVPRFLCHYDLIILESISINNIIKVERVGFDS